VGCAAPHAARARRVLHNSTDLEGGRLPGWCAGDVPAALPDAMAFPAAELAGTPPSSTCCPSVSFL
jgi:hypothetical protein